MAIYHLNSRIITRSKKSSGAKTAGARGSTASDRRVSFRSVVAAAAYRAGVTLTLAFENNPFTRYLLAVNAQGIEAEQEEGIALEAITDATNGEVYDYSRKKDVAFSEILTPADAPAWASNRQVLWNKVENCEKRVDSQLARQLDAALPKELTLEQCKTVVRAFVEENYTSKGMVADVAFHDVGEGCHNPHVHIMLTTRRIEGDDFAAKKCEEWRPKFAKAGGAVLVDETLTKERESWARHCNEALADAGETARIDHRSYAEQGITDKKPTFHIGRNAWNAEKEGGFTTVGSKLRDILSFNKLRQQVKAFQERLDPKPFFKLPFLKHARDRMEEFFAPQAVAHATSGMKTGMHQHPPDNRRIYTQTAQHERMAGRNHGEDLSR